MSDNLLTIEYKSRINKVIDYIEKNLANEFSLEELANIACFSKFHFHRIFFSMVGETLFQFIQRLRLEKSAFLLTNLLDVSITDIAYQCGFSNSSSFAKAFKEYFKISATEWRKTQSNLSKVNSNLSKTQSNYIKDFLLSSVYIEYKNNSTIWRITMDNKNQIVEVKDLPEISLAYVRHTGPYKGDAKLFESLFQKLFKWAAPRNLINFPETKSIIIYHDNPEITEENKLRTSVCITVPIKTEVSGEIGRMEIPAGKYALARFELLTNEFQEAWNWVYGIWLPQSGYQPDDRPCFEMYLNDSKDHPQNKFVVDICIPVKPL
ncbi:MAG: hypothetical protein A2086_04560 [Spirochaetes bacterium GWD1_27_9]|nr:MAG: hypothetical protein A2Z98_13650 [Spirochaetes bacterium GWB1_27_13]OHD27594.1 MAG: hypothetical protein A2Y34_18205 [Spirochaetes bacterium GWC1_27_15]OHD30344.1 MAG: hypothetical protein A2086_04560 [Spirochaetes bacterium GWD1_27_9]